MKVLYFGFKFMYGIILYFTGMMIYIQFCLSLCEFEIGNGNPLQCSRWEIPCTEETGGPQSMRSQS